MGAARAPQAHVPRRAARGQNRQRLLRIRRAREEERAIDDLATDTRKAAVWAAIAGLANIVGTAFAPTFFPGPYYLAAAVGYALVLPAIAVLHVRHAPSRAAGAILATAAGTTAVAVGLATSAANDLALAVAVVLGMWWWTIGKMWLETRVMPRPFGLITMALALLAFGAAGAAMATGYEPAGIWTAERLVFGAWTVALAVALARTRA